MSENEKDLYIVVGVNYSTGRSTLAKIYDYINKKNERVVGIDFKKLVFVQTIFDVGAIKEVNTSVI